MSWWSSRLCFETHSTTVDNERGRATGWLPGELSRHGRTQAQQLGQRRRDVWVAAVFCSDLARATKLPLRERGPASWGMVAW